MSRFVFYDLQNVHIYVNLMMRAIVFYRTARGTSPVEEFLNSLNSKQAQKVVWVLRLIEELPQIPTQYFKNWMELVACGKCVFKWAVMLFGFLVSSMADG